MKKLIRAIGLLLLTAGFLVFSSPWLFPLWSDHSMQVEIQSFQQRVSQGETDIAFEPDASGLVSVPAEQHYYKVYDAMCAYNSRIWLDGQRGLQAEDSYETVTIPDGIWDSENAIGYISIPKMGVELPIYLGASTDHLAKGAAVLGETSMPIGGINSNTVLSAHRGYRGAAFFRDIERLEVGDTVSVTNLWETLAYRVVETKIIDPNDVQSILIQPGKDLLTLLTCHPYRSGGRYRYLVYCERIN